MIENYSRIDKKLLAYGGRLYPMDAQIEIRPASVAEVRAWSNINENDPMSIVTHTIDMIVSCTRIVSDLPGKTYSPKDILEADKMVLLLAIHDITFQDRKNNLMTKGACANCGRQFDELPITAANLEFNVPDEKFDKYIDSERGLFVIETKSYGKIEYKPSTIGLGNAMLQWSQTFKPDFIKNNQSMFQVVQSLVTDWRTANDKSLRRLQIERYNTMDARELGFRASLLEQLKIDLRDELVYECPDCHETFRCPLQLNKAYRSLFIDMEAFDQELL